MLKQLIARAAMIVSVVAVVLLGSGSAFAQNQAISGKVLDAGGEPVIGAAVMVPGTTNGATTDLNGNFSLRVAPGTSLEVSCIGYATIRVTAANGMTIVLEDDTEMLEETVVIGYGVQKKSDLTGSVASVRSEDLENRSTTDAAAALQGKVRTMEERPALMQMAQTPADDEARQLIKHRYDVLSELFAAVVSDDHERCNAVLDGLEKLVADPAVFTRQLRLIYARLQPTMMSHLLNCGLTEREVDICCLYALGLNGKAIQQYTHNGRHFQHVGQIRKKFGLGEHDKDIDGYIRDLLR